MIIQVYLIVVKKGSKLLMGRDLMRLLKIDIVFVFYKRKQ